LLACWSRTTPSNTPVGTALYLLGHIAFLFRTTRHIFRPRTVGAAVLVALIPAAIAISALATLALVTAVCVLVVAYEVIPLPRRSTADPASRALVERA